MINILFQASITKDTEHIAFDVQASSSQHCLGVQSINKYKPDKKIDPGCTA
jgi:hypothetical protein